jgi:hypothetical protein
VIEEGKPAPDFELQSDSGETVKLSELRGRPVVLYFYPKDDTPGCNAVEQQALTSPRRGEVIAETSAAKEGRWFVLVSLFKCAMGTSPNTSRL